MYLNDISINSQKCNQIMLTQKKEIIIKDILSVICGILR